ncbi:MFS transporter [Corynebacterium cystitidis]|uniref:Predicted arabinose efflux permease, MFS family n=1 Tax=Corynebacterium cystitidis DSM 20524 TaxID=1121357 RepID=A0A1H9TPU3_9CORY|nr:MFS transporter [Corynebacterium cystitidis]WJY82010.1 Inner membrane metabolite transport protein YhjE [Corynebacterium cystitidis DSM 20524]SER98939.1 Predicted arabinose efflux permease, MFS family [Corynebacterium cystitidis DSM 20524]SNV80874.1 transporter [Corynebacterium cystitidis]
MSTSAPTHGHHELPADTQSTVDYAAQAPSRKEALTNEHKRVLGGAMVGTTIEWFDFFIYAQAAGLIFAAQYFNPATNDNPGLAQIVAWASLGISFLFRPLGAVIAGHLGDRLGRKPVLVITLIGMGGATFFMGLLPNYAAIGIAAPIILVLLRIVQGLSAGGEWGGAALIAVEHAPVLKRGYFGAFPQVGVPAGMALATVFMLVVSSALTPEQFETFGWRIPFVSSIVLIGLGFWIRSLVEESPVFEEMTAKKKTASTPLGSLFRNHAGLVVLCALIFAGVNAAGYLAIAYFASYGTNQLGMERPIVLALTLMTAIAWIISTLVAGKVSDVIGRKQTFVIGYVLMMVWAIPTWILIDTANVMLFGIAVVILGALLGVTYGPQPALYAEMFPARVRLSGLSIGYALGSIIGGAFAPMIAELILDETGNSLYIGVYILIISFVSLIGVFFVPKGIQGRDLSK